MRLRYRSHLYGVYFSQSSRFQLVCPFHLDQIRLYVVPPTIYFSIQDNKTHIAHPTSIFTLHRNNKKEEEEGEII